MKIEFSKENNPAESIDVCLLSNNGSHQQSLQTLNLASNISNEINLYFSGPESAVDFIKSSPHWNFKEINFYKPKESEIKTINFLCDQGSSNHILFLVNGEFHTSMLQNIASVASQNPDSCLAVSILTDESSKDKRFSYTPIGIASLQVPCIPRSMWSKIGGLDDSYDSINSSVQDLTLRLFFNDYKFVYLSTDVCVYHDAEKIENFYPETKKDSETLISKFCHMFPEDKYHCDLPYYTRAVEAGYKKMSESRAVICGLARGIAGHWRATGEARFNHLASLFKDHAFIVYENDSEDETVDYLESWQMKDPERISLTTEKLDRERLGGMGQQRVVRMAEYRNKCLDKVREKFLDYDYYILIDMDLTGGFSYDGVANTIGSEFLWSGVAANGKNSRRGNHVYWDTFAHRDLGHGMGTHGGRMKGYHGKYATSGRGDPWVKVNSAFGGMAIYKIGDVINSTYTGEASEHVPFHLDIIQRGGNIFMNPNLVVLYNYLDWCEDKNRNINFNIHKFYDVMRDRDGS